MKEETMTNNKIVISPIRKMRRHTEELLRLLCKIAEEREAEDIACRCMVDIQKRISRSSFELNEFIKWKETKKNMEESCLLEKCGGRTEEERR